MNQKPITDNKEKAKSKKKKEALEIALEKLEKLQIDDQELSGKDIATYGDILAGAKKAVAAIEIIIEEAETVIKSAMLRQWCEHFAINGHMPDLRRPRSSMATFKVVQQKVAKVTIEKAESLKKQGIDLEPYTQKKTYSIRMGSASAEATKKIIESLKKILGDDYEGVVSEYISVGADFFEKYDQIIKESLGEDEELVQKMISILRVLNPTVQMTEYDSDLPEAAGYDLALEFAHISAQRKEAIKQAKREAKAHRAEQKKAQALAK